MFPHAANNFIAHSHADMFNIPVIFERLHQNWVPRNAQAEFHAFDRHVIGQRAGADDFQPILIQSDFNIGRARPIAMNAGIDDRLAHGFRRKIPDDPARQIRLGEFFPRRMLPDFAHQQFQ